MVLGGRRTGAGAGAGAGGGRADGRAPSATIKVPPVLLCHNYPEGNCSILYQADEGRPASLPERRRKSFFMTPVFTNPDNEQDALANPSTPPLNAD